MLGVCVAQFLLVVPIPSVSLRWQLWCCGWSWRHSKRGRSGGTVLVSGASQLYSSDVDWPSRSPFSRIVHSTGDELRVQWARVRTWRWRDVAPSKVTNGRPELDSSWTNIIGHIDASNRIGQAARLGPRQGPANCLCRTPAVILHSPKRPLLSGASNSANARLCGINAVSIHDSKARVKKHIVNRHRNGAVCVCASSREKDK